MLYCYTAREYLDLSTNIGLWDQQKEEELFIFFGEYSSIYFTLTLIHSHSYTNTPSNITWTTPTTALNHAKMLKNTKQTL